MTVGELSKKPNFTALNIAEPERNIDGVYIGDLLQELLCREGYRVLRAYSGTEALLLLKQEKADLILLDLMLPGLSGEELLPRLEGTPVIVLSAKSDVQGKVQLLLGGAADYITKPFDAGELLARVAVQLRRSACGQSARLSYGDMELDLSSHQLTVGAVPVRLTRTEFAILKLLTFLGIQPHTDRNLLIGENIQREQLVALLTK